MATLTLTDARRDVLHRRIRFIVAFTIAYNVIEAVIAIAAGSAASSAALIGFGLDSTIEVLSAAAVAWQFTRRDPQRWEKPTLRVIAVAFFALAAYVSVSSVLALLTRAEVEHSGVGIALAAVSVIVMPFASLLERKAGLAGRRLSNRRRRLQANPDLQLPFGRRAHWLGAQQHPRVVVGGRRRRPRDHGLRHSRGHRSMEGRRLRHLSRTPPRGNQGRRRLLRPLLAGLHERLGRIRCRNCRIRPNGRRRPTAIRGPQST